MGTSKLKLQAEPVTQEMFNRLPGLLTRQQFQLVTGLSDRDLDDMREAQEIGYHHRKARDGRKKSYGKYYKTDAARIGGFKM